MALQADGTVVGWGCYFCTGTAGVSSVDGANFTPIPGATAFEYSFVTNASDDGTFYRAVVSNAAGRSRRRRRA